MKKIKVTLNYNNWEKKLLQVPEDWSDAQITKVVIKKYGKLDFYKWEHVIEEPVEA
jgi:hypothetical protein